MTRTQHWLLVAIGGMIVAAGFGCGHYGLPLPIGLGLQTSLCLIGGFMVGRFWP